ncbi:MAG: DUF1232 domain-containing protein [Ignavibacteriales bacterium]|nr:DUF1232 domain-containing protein [Ignavibacteriales bacterium]MCF8314604.1 DUF1232 domain-containing protein [Ignavibacteriales bacterium]MCF8436359.1 DUF1232 domain-containing protein [Ignavibacteriales bacterium]
MNKQHEDFYLKLRKEIKIWAEAQIGENKKWLEYILLLPDLFHLIAKLVTDPEVPKDKKIKLGLAILYFISPMDIIPEIITGPVGYLDDLAFAAYVLNDLINNIDNQIIIRNWAGEGDILYIVKNILVNADKMIGKGLWEKIKKRV